MPTRVAYRPSTRRYAKALAAGATIASDNGFGSTPLHIAAAYAHRDVVKWLVLELGADLTKMNDKKRTPLLAAKHVQATAGGPEEDAMVRLRALRTLSHLSMRQKESLFQEQPEAVSTILPRLEDEDALVSYRSGW